MALTNLGEGYHALARLRDARAALTAAVRICRSMGVRDSEADALDNLAATNRDAGLLTEAGHAAPDRAPQQPSRRRPPQVAAFIRLAATNRHLPRLRHGLRDAEHAIDLSRTGEFRMLHGLPLTEVTPPDQPPPALTASARGVIRQSTST